MCSMDTLASLKAHITRSSGRPKLALSECVNTLLSVSLVTAKWTECILSLSNRVTSLSLWNCESGEAVED